MAPRQAGDVCLDDQPSGTGFGWARCPVARQPCELTRQSIQAGADRHAVAGRGAAALQYDGPSVRGGERARFRWIGNDLVGRDADSSGFRCLGDQRLVHAGAEMRGVTERINDQVRELEMQNRLHPVWWRDHKLMQQTERGVVAGQDQLGRRGSHRGRERIGPLARCRVVGQMSDLSHMPTVLGQRSFGCQH